MTITGLENNYYLSQNDIWISVNGFVVPIAMLQLTVKNLTTNQELPIFKMYASPNNDLQFNICKPIRALFPETNHISNNNLQSFELKFTAKFVDSNIADEEIILEKYFIRGGRNKNANDEWYLTSSTELVVGKWIDYGIDVTTYAQKVLWSDIVESAPSNQFKVILKECNYKIIKFLNSIGGYQYFVFEKFQIKNKSKSGKTIDVPTQRLRKDNFKNTAISNGRVIELYAKTPMEIQEVFSDLVNSQEVYLYNNLGNDDDAKWEKLKLDNNESIENNYERVFENKISFELPNYTIKQN